MLAGLRRSSRERPMGYGWSARPAEAMPGTLFSFARRAWHAGWRLARGSVWRRLGKL